MLAAQLEVFAFCLGVSSKMQIQHKRTTYRPLGGQHSSRHIADVKVLTLAFVAAVILIGGVISIVSVVFSSSSSVALVKVGTLVGGLQLVGGKVAKLA